MAIKAIVSTSDRVYSGLNLALVRTIFILALIQGKAMGNHLCEKFPQKNDNGKGTLHNNRRRSESSMAPEEKEEP